MFHQRLINRDVPYIDITVTGAPEQIPSGLAAPVNIFNWVSGALVTTIQPGSTTRVYGEVGPYFVTTGYRWVAASVNVQDETTRAPMSTEPGFCTVISSTNCNVESGHTEQWIRFYATDKHATLVLHAT